MAEMKSNMLKKAEMDTKAAVQKYQIAQKKLNMKIYKTMKTQMPKQMRAVIQNAALAFRKGKVNKQDVMKVMDRHFSDEVFEALLRCA